MMDEKVPPRESESHSHSHEHCCRQEETSAEGCHRTLRCMERLLIYIPATETAATQMPPHTSNDSNETRTAEQYTRKTPVTKLLTRPIPLNPPPSPDLQDTSEDCTTCIAVTALFFLLLLCVYGVSDTCSPAAMNTRRPPSCDFANQADFLPWMLRRETSNGALKREVFDWELDVSNVEDVDKVVLASIVAFVLVSAGIVCAGISWFMRRRKSRAGAAMGVEGKVQWPKARGGTQWV